MYHLRRRTLNDAYVASSQPTIKRPRISRVDLKKSTKGGYYYVFHNTSNDTRIVWNWSNEELAQIFWDFNAYNTEVASTGQR